MSYDTLNPAFAIEDEVRMLRQEIRDTMNILRGEGINTERIKPYQDTLIQYLKEFKDLGGYINSHPAWWKERL